MSKVPRDLQVVLRNALITGEIIPNVEGTGALTRLRLHHARSFVGHAQILRATQRGYLKWTGITTPYDLNIYTLTDEGREVAQALPAIAPRSDILIGICEHCGNNAIPMRDGNRVFQNAYWCYYCEVCTNA